MRHFYNKLEKILKSVEKTLFVAGLVGVLSAGNSVSAQIKPRVEWEATFGGSYRDMCTSVLSASDGGYVLTGKTKSLVPDNWQLYLVKADASGNLLWQKSFGGADRDYGYSVQETKDGSYIIAGETRSFGAGDFDAYFIKTDPLGNPILEKTFGGRDYDYCVDIKETQDGGYVLVGKARSFSKNQGFDAWIVKSDASGDLEWQRTFGGTLHDYFHEVRQTSDGGYIMAGATESFPPDNWNAYIIKTDSEGSLVWEKIIGGENVEGSSSIQEIVDGYIVAGTVTGGRPYRADPFLLKLDFSGNILWERIFDNGELEDGLSSLEQTLDTGFLLAGQTRSFGAGDTDVYLLSTDSLGNLLWQKTFGGRDADGGLSLQKTRDGGYVIGGYTGSFGAGDWDMYLIKLCPQNSSRTFIRSDSNGDGITDISDAIHTLNWLFSNGRNPSSYDAADTNEDGRVDISDAIYTLGFLFTGANPEPPNPFPKEGADQTLDDLGCD